MKPHVAFLDTYDTEVRAVITTAMPRGWRVTFPDEADRSVADVWFAGWTPIRAGDIAAAPRLRLIQKLGAGVDNIDVAAAERHGVAVARLAGGNAGAVAEHAVLLMLATLRGLIEFDGATRAGQWRKERARAVTRGLAGKQVGLVGFGAIGREVARRLAGFGTTVCYYDPRRPGAEVEAELRTRYRHLDELLATSDVVSLHVPLKPDTRHLLDGPRIARMKSGAVLVNTARGGVVDERALADALHRGRLAGAGVDTFEPEPPAPDSPLLSAPRVVVTPHQAGAIADNVVPMLRRAVGNVASFLDSGAVPCEDAVSMC
ncbi:2-hydroxyacid dehydrogenase [Prauserella endophytica]|uniref:Dehydrogenase n=1 Tax=Prauserella endophytica TaxID=1592324 RepID=A0ABY2S3Y9_9PSEU|nr:2-hydroxyacid dehydrogenase [Prauserella endophytica]TKG70519.1 dehydrogenase [Prauserella endophytica]